MYVLMHRTTRITGRKIAQALGLDARFKTPKLNDTVAIRWGTAEHMHLPSDVQDAKAIAKAGNKLITLQICKNAGVPVPLFVTHSLGWTEGVWFGRRAHGMCGRDIKIYRAGVDVAVTGENDFYTKYIPNVREYRIHVFGEAVLGVMGKYLDFPDQAGDGYIKNYAHGYRYRTPAKALKQDRLDAAVGAVKALGLDFGAVDLIIGEDGNPYVLEVNTAPGLATLTFGKYVEEFRKRLGL